MTAKGGSRSVRKSLTPLSAGRTGKILFVICLSVPSNFFPTQACVLLLLLLFMKKKRERERDERARSPGQVSSHISMPVLAREAPAHLIL